MTRQYMGLVAAVLIGCGGAPSATISSDNVAGKADEQSSTDIADPELATSIRCLPEYDQEGVGTFAYIDIIRGDQTWQQGTKYKAAVAERDSGKLERFFGDGYDLELTQCTLTTNNRFRFETKEYSFDLPLPGRDDEVDESSCEALWSSATSSTIAIDRYRRYTARGGTLLRHGAEVPVALFCYVSVHAETCSRAAR